MELKSSLKWATTGRHEDAQLVFQTLFPGKMYAKYLTKYWDLFICNLFNVGDSISKYVAPSGHVIITL
jgi:hypothetical protein